MIHWVHFGDLHASNEDGWQSLQDLSALVDDANSHLRGMVDFAFLPGDNANHGEAEQYRRIAQVLGRLQLPWHAVPGDHDFFGPEVAHVSLTVGDGRPVPMQRDSSAPGLWTVYVQALADGDPNMKARKW